MQGSKVALSLSQINQTVPVKTVSMKEKVKMQDIAPLNIHTAPSVHVHTDVIPPAPH